MTDVLVVSGAAWGRLALAVACAALAQFLPLSAAQSEGSPLAESSPAALRDAGEFAAAFEVAWSAGGAEALTLAAQAAVDHVVYELAPSGAPADEQRFWLERALAAARAARDLAPDSPDALMQYARARGELARRTGVLQNLDVAPELRRAFERVLELRPDDPDALVALGMWHLELVQAGVGWLYGGRRDQVLPLVSRGVEAAPERVNLRVEYALALHALGQEEEAREQLRLALELPAPTAVDRAEQERARRLLEGW